MAPAAPVRHDPRGHGGAGHPSGGGSGVRGRRRHRHAGHGGRGAPDRGGHRHRGSRQLPARAGPVRARALQQARRQRLRTLRRARHIRPHRRAPDAVRVAGVAARRPLGQPAGHPGRGREDRGQAADQVRRPRRHLLPPRRADAQAARELDRERGAGPFQRAHHPARARRAARRPRRPADPRRLGPGHGGGHLRALRDEDGVEPAGGTARRRRPRRARPRQRRPVGQGRRSGDRRRGQWARPGGGAGRADLRPRATWRCPRPPPT